MNFAGYKAQVQLLLRVLPLVATESCFALKGGTAINLFLRNMPRLSVDIDLTYLPIEPREVSLNGISNALKRIQRRIASDLKGVRVVADIVKGVATPSTLRVALGEAQIKIEVNLVLRGAVYPTTIRDLCVLAQETFESFASISCLSLDDLYGGKICAALDRQHPRDLFDVHLLLENEGLTEGIRKAFVIYLASHPRPMNELLNPNWKDIHETYERDFVGMAEGDITQEDLVAARDKIHRLLLTDLTQSERRFLVSMKEGAPDWGAVGVPDIENLPGIAWKLKNIRAMNVKKREESLDRLKRVLGM
jgi:predicted nucleotidyltransferase component of viral defense system